MKKFLTVVSCIVVGYCQAQNMAVALDDLKGGSVEVDSLISSNSPVVLSFWATWCKPCIQELTAIDEVLEDWKEETGVQLYAIATDDARTVNRVLPSVNARGWEIEVLSDSNGDLMRKLGVNNVPHTLIFYKGKVVWQHSSYTPGDEEELYEKLLSLGQ